ncbi:hypothetical protein D1007_39902 [Hordeum vulgare]|nr:hypothetical protein D1007_39902 [Hordeum vulgare]
MASTLVANFSTSGGAAAAVNLDLENFFDQLDLNDEEFNDVEFDKEDPGIKAGVRAEDVVVNHMPIWLQIHKLPDPYCNKEIVEKLLKGVGKILEMRLNDNIRGDYVRVRVNHDIQKPLTKFVSIVRAKERQFYLVHYEMLAWFCKFCGLICHEHKECGLGVHDEKKLKFGDWLYADGPNSS